MAEYQSLAHGGGASLFGEDERTLIGALKERYSEPANPVMKVLSTLAIPQQIVSSMIRESVERSKQPFAPEIPMGQAALRGIADPRTSYGDIPGVGPGAGLFLDLTADPVWFTPTKFINAPLRLAAGTGKKALVYGVNHSKAFDHVATRVMTKLQRNYEIARAGYAGYENAVEIPTRMGANEVHFDLMHRAGGDIRKLVPDEERYRKILVFSESIPATVGEKELISHPTFAALPGNEQEAVRIARRATKTSEALRIQYGTMTPKMAQELEERTSTTYFQRIGAQKDDFIRDLDRAIEEHGAAWNKEQIDGIRDVQRSVADLGDTVSDAYVRELKRLHAAGKVPKVSYQQFRSVSKSLKALEESDNVADQILYAMAEKDVATVLRVENTATARSIYRKLYLDNWKEYATKEGVLVREKDLPKIPEAIRRQARGRREWVPIDGVPELKGYFAPRVLAVDLKDVLLSPIDPERVKDAVGILRRVNGWWRAWATGPIPIFHVRNAVDSWVWRNAAAGMRPHDTRFMFYTANLWKSGLQGQLDDAGRAAYREAIRGGAFRANFVEETRRMIGVATKPGNVVRTLLDPAYNPAVQAGLSVGSGIEDIARGSMFFWRRSKGDSVAEAMKWVNKWHIDYRYGLTPWMSKARDHVAPFISFTRFNMPLTLETLVNQPKLVAAVGHGQRAIEDIVGNEPDFPLSPWLVSQTPLRIKYDQSTDTHFVFLLGGWWSFSDFNKWVPKQLVETAKDLLSPAITTPLEVITNYSFYRKQPLDRPGEQFTLFGKRLDIPFGKRLESVIRDFRPINEADRVIDAASTKYGDTAIERGVNAFNRALVGKTYPVQREQQIRVYSGVTRVQLEAIRRGKRIAKENEDEELLRELEEKERELKAARKRLGIK